MGDVAGSVLRASGRFARFALSAILRRYAGFWLKAGGLVMVLVLGFALAAAAVNNPLETVRAVLGIGPSQPSGDLKAAKADMEAYMTDLGPKYAYGTGSCKARLDDYLGLSKEFAMPWQAPFAAQEMANQAQPAMSREEIAQAVSPCFHYVQGEVVTVTTTVTRDAQGHESETSETSRQPVWLLDRVESYDGVHVAVWGQPVSDLPVVRTERQSDGTVVTTRTVVTHPNLEGLESRADYSRIEGALSKIWQAGVNQGDVQLYEGAVVALLTGNENVLETVTPIAGLPPAWGGSGDLGGTPVGPDGWTWPVAGYTKITSPFGPRILNGQPDFHPGVDIAVPEGTPVLAAHAGTVVEAGEEGACGFAVGIAWPGGKVRYCHNSAVEVTVGQQVSLGQEVSRSGSTGEATGPHLHFETYLNGQLVDPLSIFHPASGDYLQTVHAIPVPPEWEYWFERAAQETGVPVEILEAIGRIESGFDPNAVGPPTDYGQAEGMMQMMPSTFSAYATDADGNGIVSPFDAPDEILAAAKLLVDDGVGVDPRQAVYLYNHSWEYVDAVLRVAQEYRAMGG